MPWCQKWLKGWNRKEGAQDGRDQSKQQVKDPNGEMEKVSDMKIRDG